MKMGKTKGRGRLVKEKTTSSVVDMLRLGRLLDFQVEMLKRQLGLQLDFRAQSQVGGINLRIMSM